jgi:hypothetical protein
MEKPKRYKCEKCGWIGTKVQMMEGTKMTEGGKVWSDMVCPRCRTFYWQLDEYEEVTEAKYA